MDRTGEVDIHEGSLRAKVRGRPPMANDDPSTRVAKHECEPFSRMARIECHICATGLQDSECSDHKLNGALDAKPDKGPSLDAERT